MRQLRQAGQLDEALYMASELLVQSPNDVWAWRAWAWVKFDQLKLAQSHHLQFAEILQELWTMPSLL
ncbi:tetratricopeptide repeat protein, partial [Emticicia sp. ODNR4P]|nr:tetratricopeptide repeat protein [Emticicia sp. ODNR4P]